MSRNYILIGAGGTGSILFPLLTRYLQTYQKSTDEQFSITIIDGKAVSAEKLDRQLFTGQMAGANKAQAIIEQYASDPDVVFAVPAYLNAKNIHGIKDNDVVLIAADNYPVRARIEKHAKKLENITILNGGNEMRDGSMQIYMRRDGADITPPMSQGHPELLENDKRDPAYLSCEAIAALPGGEQTIIANMMSATAMLNGLNQVHEWESRADKSETPAEEVFFDLNTFAMRAVTRPSP